MLVASKFSDESIKEKLAAIDWNFPHRVKHSPIEGLHPYPAKFITELPSTLLDILPLQTGTVVLDPFVGSGATIVESQKRGLPAVGIDLNPIACLISRVKTNPVPRDLTSTIESIDFCFDSLRGVEIPTIPNLDHWFSEPVQSALARLLHLIHEAPTRHQDILRLALSSVIVRVSNQDSDTRYAAVEKDVSAEQVRAWFLRAALRANKVLKERGYPLSEATIIEGDTLALAPHDIGHKTSLIITSPPYPNAYEYWLYHKYRMWWLGYDPLFVKEREIGARAHFFKKNHHTADSFVRQMEALFRSINAIATATCHACFVVGRSKIHGEIIDNANIIENAGAKFGFRTLFSRERVVSPHRKSFNLSHANIKTETVLILQRK